jgi:photosystem II stability/assembly factor-like uncharacterized protein
MRSGSAYFLTAALLLLPPARGEAGGAPTWTSVGADGGRIAAFAQAPSAPNRMYAHPDRLGLYRSDDRGDTWAPVSTGLPLDAAYQVMAVSPADEDLVLLAGTASVLMRSTDAGVSWDSIAIADNWGVPKGMAFDPADPALVLVATAGGVVPGMHRSTDAGLTWSPAATAIGNANCVAFQPASAGIALAGGAGGVFRSTDGGSTWAAVDTGGIPDIRSISFCRDQPMQVWAGGGAFWNETILTSTNGGLGFGPTAAQPPWSSPNGCRAHVAAHPQDPLQALVLWRIGACQLAMCPPRAELIRTTDGGASWSTSASYDNDTDVRTLAYDLADANRAYIAISGEVAAAGTDGIRRSLDGGQTWSNAMPGIRATRIRGLGHDGEETIWIRPADVSHLYRAETPQSEWMDVGASGGVGASLFYVNPAAAGVLHEAGSFLEIDIYVPWHRWSTDGGATWAQTLLPQTMLFEYPAAIASNSLFHTFYVWSNGDFGSSPLVNRTVDGLSFDTFEAPVLPAAAVVDPLDSMHQFAIGEASPGAVYMTGDGGENWTEFANGLPTGRGVDILADPANGQHLLAVYETAGAWESPATGFAWTPVPSPPASSVVVAADWDPATNRVFLATEDDGVWVTDLGFVTEGLPTRDLVAIDYLPGSDAVILGTEHAGVYVLTLPPPAVDAPSVAVARTGLRVHPSPFAESLTVELDLPAAGAASSVVVYDVAGRRVATLLREGTRTGRQTVTWDGRTADGSAAAPGAYFVSARIGEERQTRRAVLLR